MAALPASDLPTLARKLARTTEAGMDLARIRQKYPNAYQQWTAVSDRRLMEAYTNGGSVAELAEEFGRNRNAIRSRLVKLGIDPDGPRPPPP
jgi:hypothetical protein